MITIQEYNLEGKKRADSEAIEAVNTAIGLIANKKGYKGGNEVTWNAELSIYWGHNIYTTSIRLNDARGSNDSAYFCNGAFWLYRYPVEVELC
ncbi:MAG: hypothetical protein LBI82_12905 [Dysgonamonadaceae bacterium]|jgi:hypothetical protein|nr:hypothetical protein [Dysgonamonadaceae bacterium]